jgi:L-lactate dehydrogenase complex protein LldE
MTVGLFIPRYVDQFYPAAAKAVLQLLEKRRVITVYSPQQTRCCLPMSN